MQEEKMSFQQKIVKHKLSKFYRIAFAVILIIVMVVVVKVSVENHVYEGYESVRDLGSMGSQNSVFLPYNGNILCYSQDGMSAYDLKGNQLWNQTYEMQAPIVDINGAYVVVGDYKGSVIYVMDGSGLTAEIETNKIIMKLTVSAQGVVTATLDDKSVTWLNLYSQKGDEIASIKTTMDKSGFPLATSMSADNEKLAVSYVKAGGNGISSSIAFYNFGDVGQNATDKIVSGYDYDASVIPFLHYLSNETAVAIGEKEMIYYSGKQIPDVKTAVELDGEIESVYYGSYIGIVYRNEDGSEPYRFELYDLNGDSLFSQKFDMEYSDILIEDNMVVVYNAAQVIMWSKNGIEKYSGDLGGKIRSIIPTSKSNRFAVVREDKIESIKLK